MHGQCVVEATVEQSSGIQAKIRCPTCKQEYFGAVAEALARAQLQKAKSSGDREDVCTAQETLAQAAWSRGRHAEAIAQFEKILDGEVRRFGAGHISVAQARVNLGTMYEQMRRSEEALKMFEMALPVTVEYYGDQHLEVAAIYHNIGSSYMHAESRRNHLDESLAFHQKALAIRSSQLGEDDEKVLALHTNIALVYKQQGKIGEALELLEKVLQSRVKVLGCDHPDISDLHYNIGGLYAMQNRLDDAVEIYERALSTRLKHLGDKHMYIGFTRNQLGVLLMRLGRAAEALHQFEKSLEVLAHSLGPDHSEVLGTRKNLKSCTALAKLPPQLQIAAMTRVPGG